MNRGLRVLPVLVLLAGCSSPGDVQALHDAEMAKYTSDMARAQEWNQHVWGIPASGWVAILVTVSILLAGLLVMLGLWAREATADRRRHAATLAIEEERTKQAALAAQRAEWESVQRYQPPPMSKKADEVSS